MFQQGCSVCSQHPFWLNPQLPYNLIQLLERTPSLNQGSHPDFSAIAWTNEVIPVIVRSVIDFDLSSIPSGSTVNSAYLSLYNNPTSPNNSGQHSSTDGPNTAYLRRVTSTWSEFDITWDNQPTTATVNEVELPESTDSHQDYADIDVTPLIQDMIDNPSTSFGLMISLETEQHYRSMIFSSSDHPDSTKHPKLVVNYTSSSATRDNAELNKLLKAYPNPSSDYVMIELDYFMSDHYALKLYDSQGRLVRSTLADKPGLIRLDRKDLPSGSYFLQVEVDGHIVGLGKIILH